MAVQLPDQDNDTSPRLPEEAPFGMDATKYTPSEEDLQPTDQHYPEAKEGLQEKAQRYGDHFKSFKEYAKEQDAPVSPDKPSLLKKLTNNSNANTAETATKAVTRAGVKQTEKAALRKAETGLVARVGGRLALAAGGVASAGVSTAVAIALTVKDIASIPFVTKIIRAIGIVLLVMAVAVGIVALSGFLGQFGASESGSIPVTPETDTVNPAIAAHDSGQLVGDGVENLDRSVEIAKKLLANPPKGANVGEATRILDEIKSLRAELQTTLSATDKAERAKFLKEQYRQRVTDLYAALYPGRKLAQARVLALLDKQIKTGSASGCNAKRDIQNLAPTANMYNLIFEASSVKPITVHCLFSGHRKYVGKSPTQGFPYCGSERIVQSAKISAHCVGRGVDMKYDSDVYKFLIANKQRLKIRSIDHEYPGLSRDHLHIEVMPD